MKKQNYPEVFIKLNTFDIDKMHVMAPETNTFKASSGMDISVTKSLVLYENDEGELCVPYIQGPRQRVFFSGSKPITKQPGDDESTIVGYQVTYGVTSFFTKDEPTEEEKYFISVLDKMMKKSKQKTVEFSKEVDSEGESVLPPPTVNAVNGGKDDWFKPVYAFPDMENPKNPKGKKIPDKDKPQRMYVKLITSGRDATLKVHTKVYDGEETINVADIVNGDSQGACEIEPVFKVESIYFGPHGSTKPYGASLQFRLDQCNYYPIQVRSTPRFIPPPLSSEKMDALFGKSTDSNSPPRSPRSPREKKTSKKSPRNEAPEEEEDKLKERIKRESLKPRRHHRSKRATGDE